MSVGGASRGGSAGGSSAGGSSRGGSASGSSRGASSHGTSTGSGKSTGSKSAGSAHGKSAGSKSTGSAHCNQFAAAYAAKMGDPTLSGTANQMIGNQLAKNYNKVSAAEAMKAAAEGKLSFAAWSNPTGHGHIAAVVGETAGKPAIAQAGPKNYNFVGVNYGFSHKHEPSYYVHK